MRAAFDHPENGSRMNALLPRSRQGKVSAAGSRTYALPALSGGHERSAVVAPDLD